MEESGGERRSVDGREGEGKLGARHYVVVVFFFFRAEDGIRD